MKSLILLLVLFQFQVIYGQYCDSDQDYTIDVSDSTINSIKDFFVRGHVNGHLRNYFMSTLNDKDLSDHYANAIGGSIKFISGNWKGFEFGLKAIYTFNAFSSDLNGIYSDGQPAKWEMELFDILDPGNQYNLARLEELYIGFRRKRFLLKIGRMNIDEDPLLKRRDGRMMSFVYQGLWNRIDLNKNTHVYNGFINGVAPRGMTKWFSLNEAIGITNNGLLNDSTKMDYHQSAHTDGMLVNGVVYEHKNTVKVQIWNYYLLHLHNTIWTQADFKVNKFGFGIQYVVQFADPYQNKLAEINQYFDPDKPSHSVALQLKYQLNQKLQVRAAHLYITDNGRFLFPREMTRENFYTSIPRSWMDGLGNSHVSLLDIQFNPSKKLKKDFSFDLIGQFVNSPVIEDLRMNKYGTPDYFQLNVGSTYKFSKKLDGLSLNLLYVYRYSDIPDSMTLAKEYYKVNFHHWNLIIEFLF